MRRKREKQEEIDEVEDGEELSEKETKKLKQKESAEKRKNAKKKDKVARWGGIILFGLVMFVGFLLLVSGEIKNEKNTFNQEPLIPYETQSGTVILK